MFKNISIVATDESWGYVATKKSIAFEIAENLMSFLIVYSLYALIYHQFISDEIVILRGLLLFIPICALTYTRKKYGKPYIPIAVSVILLGMLFFLPIDLGEKIGYILILFISCCISLYKRTKEFARYYGISVLIGYYLVLIGLCMIAAWTRDYFIIDFIIIVAIINSFIFIIYFYLQKTLKLLTWESLYQEKFKERIRNLKIATSTVIISTIGMLMLFSQLSGIFNFMDKAQNEFINWLSKTNGNAVVEKIEQSTNTNSSSDMKLSEELAGGPSKAAESLVSILEAVLYVILAIVAIIFLWQLIKKILEFYRSLFNKQIETAEERESVFSMDEIKEKLIKGKFFSKINPATTNREKIRRIYAKKIQGFIAKGADVHKSQGPREIEKNISYSFNISIKDATNLYEKARYGKESSTDHEVELMKKLK